MMTEFQGSIKIYKLHFAYQNKYTKKIIAHLFTNTAFKFKAKRYFFIKLRLGFGIFRKPNLST